MKAEAIILLGALTLAVLLWFLGRTAVAAWRTVSTWQKRGPEMWEPDARPTLEGGTEIVLIRRREARPFKKLPPEATEAEVDDRMIDAQLRCDTLNRPALQRKH